MSEIPERMSQGDLDVAGQFQMSYVLSLVGDSELANLQIIDGVDRDFHDRYDAMIRPFDSNKIFIRRKPVIFRLRQRGLKARRPQDSTIQIKQMNEKPLRVIHCISSTAIECDPVEQRATAS